MVITGTYDLVANPNWKQLQLQEIYFECDTSLSPVTINLFPIIDLDKFWNVKIYITDLSNNASSNPITINSDGGDTINRQGYTNFTIDYNGGDAVLTVVSGNKWSAFSQTVLTQTGLTYKGAWNANTNTPTLTSGVGTAGDYYIVSVAGNTNLDGTIDWQVGDWAIFEGTTSMWQKIDNHDVQAYNTVQDEGNALPQRSIIDFTGAGVLAQDIGGKTVVQVAGIGGSSVYGSFFDTTIQTVASGSVKAMELNSVDIASNVVIQNNLLGRPTRIKVASTGVYNIQFSAQLNRTSGGNPRQIDIWLRLNELDVPYSNTSITVQANEDKTVAAWNFFANLNANEYAEIMWTQNDAIEILAQAAGVNFPATPSVILTICRIN